MIKSSANNLSIGGIASMNLFMQRMALPKRVCKQIENSALAKVNGAKYNIAVCGISAISAII
jgi:hypothetical protein